jgi:hypothetical protein
MQKFSVERVLNPHWKSTFVLLWLLFGSFARALAPHSGRAGTALNLVWGALCALIGAVAAGGAPLSHQGVFWWPWLSVFLWNSGRQAWGARFAGSVGRVGRVGLFSLVVIFIVPICAIAITVTRADFVFGFAMPGLILLFVSIAIVGVWVLLVGTLNLSKADGASVVEKWLNHFTRMGLDILSVLGGAAIVVWLGHALA